MTKRPRRTARAPALPAEVPAPSGEVQIEAAPSAPGVSGADGAAPAPVPENASANEDLDPQLANRLAGLLRQANALVHEQRPPGVPLELGACPTGCELGPVTGFSHRAQAVIHRLSAALTHLGLPVPAHPCNNDETTYQADPNGPLFNVFPGNFTKGLPHNTLGEVDPAAYCALLRALDSGVSRPPGPPLSTSPFRDDFENVPLGCPTPSAQRRLENPQAAFAYELEGADSHDLVMPAAPAFASEDAAAEMAELYWMALIRDVPFTAYAGNALVDNAVTDLTGTFSDQFMAGPGYNGQHVKGTLTPGLVFRGFTPGEQVGPYVSQFLLRDVPYGAQFISARIATLLPGVDYLTGYDAWLEVQRGCDASQSALDPVPRFIRNGRDLAQFVHVDRTFNAFLNAALLLVSGRDPLRRGEARPGIGVPYAPPLPYVNPVTPPPEEFPFFEPPNPQVGRSRNQIGFGTFGDPHLISVLVGCMYRAMHAVWYQKWSVHRRLRPEEYAGRVHLTRCGVKTYPVAYQLFESTLFENQLVLTHNQLQNANLQAPTDGVGCATRDTYLLPQVYAEGSPLHPAYGSGHSTVAGCLATLLKAFFADARLLGPVVPTPDGMALVPFTGADAGTLTVHGELEKLAGNVGIGRLWAGVHWRTDHTEALRLGEQVAIHLLRDQRDLYNEPYAFSFTSFDGANVPI